jgi:Na+-transporting NADH:ubiquinone oxidoreductase subunit A
MSKTIKIRKGLDIKLIGEADKVKSVENATIYAIQPPDFHGLTPKMTVKVGDKVKAGSVIFFNKYQEDVKYVSPVAGEIKDIIRGEKRRILAVTILSDAENVAEDFGKQDPTNMDGEAIKRILLQQGFWPFIKMRPLDVVANPKDKPRAIFVSAFDSSPLAPDYDFVLHGENEAFQAGITALSKLTEGKVHLTMRGDITPDTTFTGVKNAEIHKISSKHPAGNVGTQIHHIAPVNKGEVVWTVNALDVALIGRSLLAGHFDGSRTIAIAGSEIKKPKYV